MSIIVLEGADNTGKTTLAKELEARGYRYTHNGPQVSGDMFEEYTRQIEDVKSSENVVFDRLHLGELVYGPIARGKALITLEQVRLLNRLIYAKGGVLVLCSAPPYQIISKWQERRQDEYLKDEAQVQEVIKGYVDLWFNELRDSSSAVRYSLAQWAGRSHEYAIALCKSVSARANYVFHGAVGEPTAKYLIVGEQPGGERDLAFYSMKNSSGFLNECLWQAGFREHEMMFTNAYNISGYERYLYSVYRGRKVIALGKRAEAVCQRQQIGHMTAHHPQYVKRFKKGQYDEYVKTLRNFKEKP